MDIKEIYEYCDKVGCLSFSTWNGREVVSRIAGFFAFDDSGLYFLTMNVKPFYKQMIEYKTLSVCGMYPKTQVEIDENNLPFFIPGYTIRITGEVRELSLDEVEEKAKSNKDFNVAVHDIKKYPATKILVLYNGSGEVYDYDYGMRKRDHKLIRTAFAFGGAPLKPAGLRINENCTGCGACKEACTFKAIDEGTPYTIRRERCDECGNCYGVCPAGAISLRETN
jgi:ferredoxin